MQVRLVAFATAAILLCVGLLARHHASETAHAYEQSGRVVHAHALSEHHEATNDAHLHGRQAHSHVGACSLLAVAQTSLVETTPMTVASVLAAAEVALSPARTWPPPVTGYRLAPKTSPPAHLAVS